MTAEKQNVGTCIICDKLCDHSCPDDVFTACRNHGWNPCRQCPDFDPDAVLWG